VYGQLWLRVTHIAEDGRAEIVDIPTTLILKKGQEGIIISFAYKDGQYFLYDWLQPIAHQIIQDAGPKIVDIPLMLISGCGWECVTTILAIQEANTSIMYNHNHINS